MHTQFLFCFLSSGPCFEKKVASTCYSEDYYTNGNTYLPRRTIAYLTTSYSWFLAEFEIQKLLWLSKNIFSATKYRRRQIESDIESDICQKYKDYIWQYGVWATSTTWPTASWYVDFWLKEDEITFTVIWHLENQKHWQNHEQYIKSLWVLFLKLTQAHRLLWKMLQKKNNNQPTTKQQQNRLKKYLHPRSKPMQDIQEFHYREDK